MSYSRTPYIYSNGSEMFMDGQYIDEDVINILLYDLHQDYRKDELEERLKLGKEAKDRIAKESEEMLGEIIGKYQSKTINSKEQLSSFKVKVMKKCNEENNNE